MSIKIFYKYIILKILIYSFRRTNAFKLYHDCLPDEEISYLDFISLYPSVQKYGIYPIGHPEIKTSNFKTIDNYFGIVMVKILPPTKLLIPVLPVKCNGKLMFPLCRTCAEELNDHTLCSHNENQRCLTGTWVSEEVKKAVEMGYKVITIYEVYHWNKSLQYDKSCGDDIKDHLFVGYVNQAVKEKTEASGFPDNCVTAQDEDQYIEDFYQSEGKFFLFLFSK